MQMVGVAAVDNPMACVLAALLVSARALCSCLAIELSMRGPVLTLFSRGPGKSPKHCFSDQVAVGPGVTGGQLATFCDSKDR